MEGKPVGRRDIDGSQQAQRGDRRNYRWPAARYQVRRSPAAAVARVDGAASSCLSHRFNWGKTPANQGPADRRLFSLSESDCLENAFRRQTRRMTTGWSRPIALQERRECHWKGTTDEDTATPSVPGEPGSGCALRLCHVRYGTLESSLIRMGDIPAKGQAGTPRNGS